MSKIDITVVLNAHSEGILAHPTVLGVAQARSQAAQAGLTVEILVMQDLPTRETAEYFKACNVPDLTLLTISPDDLGQSRNAGVEEARGQWIAFLDADDIWSPNWLVASHKAATAEQREVIWHPEANLYFGHEPHIFTHIDMEDPAFDLLTLTTSNYWTALCFARREFCRAHPYPSSHLDKQLGYEDWCWNAEAIRWGALHKIVPGTVHFIRQKRGSLLHRTNSLQSLMHPTLLFKDFVDHREHYKHVFLAQMHGAPQRFRN